MIRKKIQLTVIMVILLITTPYGALAQTNEPATAQNETTTVSTAVQESSTPEKTETKAVHEEESGEELGTQLPLWSVIPFIGILLSIALFPLLAPHFWHHHFGKVSIFWSLLFAFPFLFAFKGEGIHEILHIYLIDYIPFIILLWSLFTVAGGILVRGDLVGKPSTNLIILLIGTFLSSWIGTTGSAMVLIRPLLRANANRKNKTHIVVFFIFLVANIGGSLTPLGDPPLFLGFLHGVPFFYTFHLLPDLGVASLILLSLFYLMDRYFYSREKPEDIVVTGTKPFSVAGKRNFIFLVGIIAGVLLSGFWKAGTVHVLGVPMAIQNMARDSILIIMGLLSMKFTPNRWRKENGFSWFPILEVALLFAGIFMTIIPALAILRAGTDGALAFLIRAVQEPHHYFWVTGALSSFLDNAPTYLTFMNSALGQFYAGIPESQAVHQLIAEHHIYLKAISVGAVFMGANTYIGNAPNFMVKSIAEENGVPMPSFFGYIFKYSLPILIPTFIIIQLIFFP
jgi:Na+/H+ antiporter NhaD/arsenite permease-like protein